MERHISGSGGKVSVIVTAAVALPGLAALVAGSLSQFLSLRLQKPIQCFLHASPNQFLDLPLDNFLVELYNVVGHGLPSPFECLCSNFILPETGKPCLLFLANFAQLIIPYHGSVKSYADFQEFMKTRRYI